MLQRRGGGGLKVTAGSRKEILMTKVLYKEWGKKYLVLTYFTQARPTRTTWKMYFTIIPHLELRLKVCYNIRCLALYLQFNH